MGSGENPTEHNFKDREYRLKYQKERYKRRLREGEKTYYEKNRERCLKYQNVYYQRNKEEINRRRREDRTKDREAVNQAQREYYHSNKERINKSRDSANRKAYMKRYYQENKERINAYSRRWRKANVEKCRKHQRDRYWRDKDNDGL